NESERYDALSQVIRSNQIILDLTIERYNKGLTGFLDVLQAQQAMYQTQILQIESLAIIAQQNVALHKALGVEQ
ncbi:MAG: TolC family protein, partial [Methylococcales bacterium]